MGLSARLRKIREQPPPPKKQKPKPKAPVEPDEPVVEEAVNDDAWNSTTNIKHWILQGQAFIYLIAFTSFYIQIPGLVGDRGLLPLQLRTRPCDRRNPFECPQAAVHFFSRWFHVRYEYGLHITCLLGSMLSYACLFRSLRNAATYLLLFLLYLACVESGGTFLWFQWDSLLLESGFIAIILAFLDSPADEMSLFLYRWLACRLMFASGVVKLQSGCPLWWGLKALDVHYESQCLPTPLAWLAHHQPAWMRSLSVAATFYIEIYLPPMFITMIGPLRRFSAYPQFFFMGLIMLTGNYNFFNLLYALTCLSLLEYCGKPKSRLGAYIEILTSATVMGGSLAHFCFYFRIRPDFRNLAITSVINFDRSMFDHAVTATTGGLLALACIMFCYHLIRATIKTWEAFLRRRTWRSVLGVVNLVAASFACILLFTASIVPIARLDRTTSSLLPQQLHHINKWTDTYQLTHSYGLFRSMTGAEGRPEIVLEGASNPGGPWKEIPFYTKPGDPARRPHFVLPHQPRLDWQMWFAALGAYQHNPFYLSLVYNLLRNSSDVTQMMAPSPFSKEEPLRLVRGKLYHYRFTQPGESDWWKRDFQSEYSPVFSKEVLEPYLKEHGYLLNSVPRLNDHEKQLLALHSRLREMDPTYFVWQHAALFCICKYIVTYI